MEPKIVEVEAKKFVGMKYFGDNKNNEIPQMWMKFVTRMCGIKNNPNPQVSYGISYDYKDGEFAYLACVEVSSFDDIPAGMDSTEVPAAKYAVFTHKGKLDNLKETYEYINTGWQPDVPFEKKCKNGAWLEIYDDRFLPNSDDSELDIYVPIN